MSKHISKRKLAKLEIKTGTRHKLKGERVYIYDWKCINSYRKFRVYTARPKSAGFACDMKSALLMRSFENEFNKPECLF
jgi:hypothetical protein